MFKKFIKPLVSPYERPLDAVGFGLGQILQLLTTLALFAPRGVLGWWNRHSREQHDVSSCHLHASGQALIRLVFALRCRRSSPICANLNVHSSREIWQRQSNRNKPSQRPRCRTALRRVCRSRQKSFPDGQLPISACRPRLKGRAQPAFATNRCQLGLRHKLSQAVLGPSAARLVAPAQVSIRS